MSAGRVVMVLAAGGGLGASTVSLALAARLAEDCERVVVVDTDRLGGGLDVLAGLEEEPGLRWEDLDELDGQVDAEALMARLPQRDGVAVLGYAGLRHASTVSCHGSRPSVSTVVAALAELTDVVVDTGRTSPELAELARLADRVVLLVAPGLRCLAAGRALVELLAGDRARRGASGQHDPVDPVQVWVRARRPSRLVRELVQEALGVEEVEVLADDPSVPRDADHGEIPGRGRGRLATVVGRLAVGLEPAPDQFWPTALPWAVTAVGAEVAGPVRAGG